MIKGCRVKLVLITGMVLLVSLHPIFSPDHLHSGAEAEPIACASGPVHQPNERFIIACYGGTGGFNISRHSHEFSIKENANISGGSGALLDSGLDNFISPDVDVISIGGDSDFSSSTALALEEAVHDRGKVISIRYPACEKFNLSLPGTKTDLNLYGSGLHLHAADHPMVKGLPASFENLGSSLSVRRTVSPKVNSTPIIDFDNDDSPALLMWKYGAGYVVHHTLDAAESFYGPYDDTVHYRSLIWCLSELHSAVSPGPPLNPVAEMGDAEVRLEWDPPADSGGLPVAGYNIYYGHSMYNLSLLASTIYLNHTHDSLTNGKTYYYRIASQTFAGENLSGPLLNATPLGIPSAPRDLSLTPGDSLVNIYWSPPLMNGGSPITGYELHRGPAADNISLFMKFPANVLSYRDTEVKNGRSYHYRLVALNPAWAGDSTAIMNATPTGLPDAPSGLNCIGGNEKVCLSWNGPSEDGGTRITGYRIYRGSTAHELALLASVGVRSNYNDIDGLINGLSYSYQVSACNANGEGNLSGIGNATPVTLPGKPLNFSVREGDDFVSLSWGLPLDNGGSPVTRFRLCKTLPDNSSAIMDIPVDETEYRDDNVTNGCLYSYSVSAVNGVGEGTRTNELDAVPIGLPAPPSDVKLKQVNGTVEVGWTAPADDGGSKINRYYIYRGRSEGEMAIIGSVSEGTSFPDLDILDHGKYHYRVVAASGVGESEPSEMKNITVVRAPSAPTSFRVVAEKGDALLRWDTPESGGGLPVVDYSVYRRTHGGEAIHLGSVPENTFRDGDVRTGRKYYYSVCARNAVGEGARSSEVSLIIDSGGHGDEGSKGFSSWLATPLFIFAVAFFIILVAFFVIRRAFLGGKVDVEPWNSEEGEEESRGEIMPSDREFSREHAVGEVRSTGTAAELSWEHNVTPSSSRPGAPMRPPSFHTGRADRGGVVAGEFFNEDQFMADELEKKSIKEDRPSGPLMGPKLFIEDVPSENVIAVTPDLFEGSEWQSPLPPSPPRSVDHSSPYTGNEGHMQAGSPGGRGSYRDVLDNIMRRSMEKKGSRLPRVVSSSRGTPEKKGTGEKKEGKCGLCLEEFEPDSKIITCKCGRKYHLLCASHVGQCPICDNDLKPLCDEIMDGRKVRDYSFIWGK